MSESRRGYFTWEPGSIDIFQCSLCAHKFKNGDYCSAFPEGIPEEILQDKHDHKLPFPGDKGIQFKPRS